MLTYERTKSGIAKKWEFIYYDDYINNEGFRYPLREGKSYIVLYDKEKNEIYVDSKQKVLIRLKNITNFTKYKKIARNFKREKYLKPIGHYSIEAGSNSIERYFAKYLLEEQGTSFEITAKDYDINSNFYVKVSLVWMVRGMRSEVYKHNYMSILKGSNRIPELKSILDPLEFYIGNQRKLTPREITMKRLEKLYIPG